MAAPDYTVDALLEAAREDGDLPDWEEDDARDALLRLMNRQQRLEIAALLQLAKEQYRHAVLDVVLEAGELRYDLPERAVAAGIVQVKATDDSGGLVATLNLFPSEREGERGFMGGPGQGYLEGNQLVLYSAPPNAGRLRITYNRRLSELVLLEDAGRITNINLGTGVLQISAAPADFITGAAAYDLVKATPHFDLRAMDLSATRSTTNMTFDPDELPDGLEVGDYVCRAGTTPVCQAPLELHPVLALRTAYRHLKSTGSPDASGLKDDLDVAERLAMGILKPRVEGQLPVIINTNGPGWRRWRGARR